MPGPKGRHFQQVKKCTLPNPTTSVNEKVNSVKRKRTASKPLGVAKKSKQGPDIVVTANSAMKDKVANTSKTTIIADKLSQQKDEPLKFEELEDIKKVIRNWTPPLRKQGKADLTKEDKEKPKEVLKICQQDNTTTLKGSEYITSTLASSELLSQTDAQQMGDSNVVDADTLAGKDTLITKSIAKPELHEKTDETVANVTNEAMPLQLSSSEREVDDEMDELMIKDSQQDKKTLTNLPVKNEIFQEHAVVIDITASQIKVPTSRDEDLFEGKEEMFTDIHGDDDVVLTEGRINGNNSQEIDLFEGEEDIYTKQYSALKCNIHSAITSELEDNDELQLHHTDMLKESKQRDGVTPPDSCRLTGDLFGTNVREDMCTPTNDANFLDTTPPTVKIIPLKEHNFCMNKIDTVNASKHDEEISDMYILTDDPCNTLLKSKTLSTSKSPKLFPDTDSDRDFEESTRKLQDAKLPLTDIYTEQSQEDMDLGQHLNLCRDQVKSTTQLKMDDKCLIKDELHAENVSKYIESTGEKELCSSTSIQISAAKCGNIHLRTPENLFVVKNDNRNCHNESNNVLSQSQGISSVSTSTCQKSQNESNNIQSQNKGMKYTRLTNDGSQKSQNDAHNDSASSQNTKAHYNFHENEIKAVCNKAESLETTRPIPNKENKDNASSTSTASQTCVNKPNNVVPFTMALTPQYNASQKSLNRSNNTVTPSACRISQTSQNVPDNNMITLNNDATPHAMPLTPQHNASQKPRSGSYSTTTPIKKNKDFPSVHCTSQTSENYPDNIIVELNDVTPHAMPLTAQHNASQKSQSGTNSTTTPNKENKDIPSAHSTSQTYKNGPTNTSTPTTNIKGHTSLEKKAGRTSQSQPENVCLESNDVKENRQPYLFEMDQDFELFISSSQMLAIENEMKQEMLKEAAYKSGNPAQPNEGQTAPRNVPTTCEGARMPVFSIATMPPLQQPFDWTKKVRDDRQKLRNIVQEMTNLNAMVTKVRREMWPRRRPDEDSGSVGMRGPNDGSGRSSVMFPTPHVGPNTYGASLPPGNWSRGHSSRY